MPSSKTFKISLRRTTMNVSPISALRAAMLQSGKRSENSLEKQYLAQARPALLGIGAKEREPEDDGSRKKKRKGMRHIPVARLESGWGDNGPSRSSTRSGEARVLRHARRGMNAWRTGKGAGTTIASGERARPQRQGPRSDRKREHSRHRLVTSVPRLRNSQLACNAHLPTIRSLSSSLAACTSYDMYALPPVRFCSHQAFKRQENTNIQTTELSVRLFRKSPRSQC